MDRITPVQAKDFAERWARANQAEIDELRGASPDLILRQLDSLRSVADALENQEDREREVEEVRNRWNRLRAIFRG